MRASLLPTNQQSFATMLAALPFKSIDAHHKSRSFNNDRYPKAIRPQGFQTNPLRSK